MLHLRAWRERRALTQKELADKAGVTQLSITRIETGQQNARPTTVRKLAKALRIKPEQLFRDPDQTLGR